MKVALRQYQLDAVQQARDAIRAGAKNVLIVAPTGSGKTVIASHLIEESSAKGKRSAFVVDRLSLIQQTSDTFERYGIDHGIVQGDHWRFRPSLPVQLCSVQTLIRREWPEAHLILVDEAHTVTEAVRQRVTPRNTIAIGLTATPFTKGLGQLYDAVVNVTTTNRLIEQGFLSSYVIYSCVEPDMDGVKVVAGEFEQGETQKRALQVVGDVVQEYLDKGESRKFICSAVDTAHVEELHRQFLAAGINTATYTYKDRDEDRADTVVEFRKTDSTIRGLITVTAASKGFDVPDIGCVIMARPLRSSLAEHIQFFGRGLRTADGKANCIVLDHSGNCIASGMRVLTHCGLVPIEHIQKSHKVWDGHEFVSHSGLINRGIRPVIRYAGLTATRDHRVKTPKGWRTLGECAEEQAAIITTGFGGQAVRERDGHFAGPCLAWPERASFRACAVRVRRLRLSLDRFVEQLAGWAYQGLSGVQSAAQVSEVALCASAADGAALHQAAGQWVRELRRARDRVQVFIAGRVRSVDRDGAWPAGEREGLGAGPHRQQQPLPSGQSALGNQAAKLVKSARHNVVADGSQVQAGTPGDSIRGRLADGLHRLWHVVRGHRGEVSQAFEEAEGQVWDLLDCGPRNSFTCEGLLVHNCARFWSEWNDFFEYGAAELDDGKKKPKPKKKPEEEVEAMKCPSCGHLHQPRPVCPQCGHEYPKKRAVEHVPGTLTELVATGNASMMRAHLWPQVVGFVMESQPDPERAQRRAQAIYHEITGNFAKARVETTTPVPPTREVRNRIKANQIKFAKGRQKAARETAGASA